MATTKYMREYMKKWREQNREKSRKIQRSATLKWAKKTNNLSSKKWRDKNKHKVKAENLIKREIKKGNIKRDICDICSSHITHAHHPDYNKPLLVIWLCPVHHKEAHKNSYE